ncbi:MAG: hypothetical protein ILP14_14220 [Oscillospiraceae bacterium]|nr:hypothetical protein [Oscillospiraceae bacterium]
MTTIKTSSGFEYEIDPEAMDDMDVFEDIMMMENPDNNDAVKIAATNRVFRHILGPTQQKALNKHLKALEGKVKISTYQREIKEVFQQLGELKKES